MKNIKIPVRDFDPKKDTPNPIFHIKLSGKPMEVHLSKLRNLFRKYLDSVDVSSIRNQSALDTVSYFLNQKRIELNIKQTQKLVLCFKTDINRRLNGLPYGTLE